MESPLVLNDYRLREDFAFDTPEFQVLYDLLGQYGNLPPEVLAEQTDEVERAWYQVLAQDLPAEMSSQELSEVEMTLNKALLNQDNMRIKKKVQEASHVGDTDTALEELERFNFPKEKNGVIMATKQKEVTTFDVQVAEFIRNHKQKRDSN